MADDRQYPAGPGEHRDAWRAGSGPDAQGPGQGYSRFAPPADPADDSGEDDAGRTVRSDRPVGAWPAGSPVRPRTPSPAEAGGAAPGAGAAGPGASAPGTPAPGTSAPGTSAPGAHDQGAHDQGAHHQGASAHGHGSPTHGAPAHGAPAHGAPAYGTAAQGSAWRPGASRQPMGVTPPPAGPGEVGTNAGGARSAVGPAGHAGRAATGPDAGAVPSGASAPHAHEASAQDAHRGHAAPTAHTPSVYAGPVPGGQVAPGYGGTGSGGAGGSGTGGAGSGGSGDGDDRGRRSGGRRRGVAVPIVALLTLVALLAGLVLGAVGGRYLFPEGGGESEAGTQPESPSGGQQGVQNPDRPDASVATIADIALASTVYIEARAGTVGGTGTGMIYSEDGLIITNNHVIEHAADAGQITVTFYDGTQEPAEVVGRSPGYDLAVLQVEREGLTPLVLADSEDVVIGDLVIAVGAPLGLTGTVTAGIISATNRPVVAGEAGEESYINALQTDAAINPGNSGGPLLNYDGEVVGINSVIYSTMTSSGTAGSIGLGFAIPSNQVAHTVTQLVETGVASFAQIGIMLDPTYFGEGVRVHTGEDAIVAGGPGEEAGMEPGDIIHAVDGRPVTDPSEVIVFVRANQGGDTITLTIERDGQEMDVDVVLSEVEEQI